MQMETWRDRGFVPDSDEEEEYDSQESWRVARLQEDQHPEAPKLPLTQDRETSAAADVVKSREEHYEHDHSQRSLELISDDKPNTPSHGQKSQNSPQRPVVDPESVTGDEISSDNDNESSSEDELQVVDAPRRKPAFSAALKLSSPSVQQFKSILGDNESLSSLSPPPSTIISPHESQGESQGKSPQQQYHVSPNPPQISPTHTVTKDTSSPSADKSTLDELGSILPPLDIPSDILQELSQPMRRSLRQRNPIQLHPYLLEDAKYRGLLKGAGIKPLRVPLADLGASRPRNQDESQESALELAAPLSSSQSSAFVSYHSSPPDPYSPPRPKDQHRTPISLPRNRPENGKLDTRAKKKRKLLHTGGKESSRSNQPAVQVAIENSDRTLDNGTPTADGPISPPRSRSLSSVGSVHPIGFRFPRGFSPPKTAPKGTDMASDITEPDEMEIDQPIDDYEESTASEDDNTRDEQTQQLKDQEVKELQRKIKGVLPASWLRLDLKQRDQKTSQTVHGRRQRDLFSTQAQSAKGVARKITKPRTIDADSSAQRPLLNFSDGSSSSDNESEGETRSLNAPFDVVDFNNQFQDFSGNEDDGDIPEDNRIDNMFPSLPRPRSVSKRKRSDKPKTHSVKGIGQTDSLILQTHVQKRRQRQTRLDDNITRLRAHPKSRFPTPRLGILDAPDVAMQPKAKQPQFLRIAARQARSRRDQGRSSPSGKIFKMVDRNDTEDTNKVLRDWKSGAMKQTTLPPPEFRKMARESTSGVLKIEDKGSGGRQKSQRVIRKVSTKFLESISSESESETQPHPATFLAIRDAKKDRLKPTRLGDKWIVPRAFGISSLKRNNPRTAEFEVGSEVGKPSNASFRTSLDALNRAYGNDYRRGRPGQSITLDRFLAQSTFSVEKQPIRKNQHIPPLPSTVPTENRAPQRKRLVRKRPPIRVDINGDDAPQITSSIELHGSSVDTSDGFQRHADLHKLKGPATFSVDFKTKPLPVGTFFHDSTFIGRTEFSRSLDLQKRDLDQGSGFSVIRIGTQMFRWAAWTDAVSSDFGSVVDLVTRDATAHSSSQTEAVATCDDNLQALVSLVCYVTDKLHFMDSIDRQTFVDRALHISSQLRDYVTRNSPLEYDRWKQCIRLASLNLVFANQIRQISDHRLVNPSKLEGVVRIVKDLCRQVLSLVFNKSGLAEIRRFYEDNNVAHRRESGIRQDYPSVQAYVIVFQLLQSSELFKDWFQDITLTLANDVPAFDHLQSLEDTWTAIFTTLPLNEIDKYGIARPGIRFQCKYDNWPVVQRLIKTVLDAYNPNSKPSATYISYCRVIFHRAFVLMASWGWRDCKPILDTLFDFFAKHGLYNLKNEQSFGSPSFLDYLDKDPSLEVQPNDSCFHIFLKIVGSGLRYLSGIYSKKKIMNFAWRLLPNHGRVYPKEKMLRHEDLDSLRNHHDLLCTLYWAVPEGCRPRVETIRDLVDPATSHLETCNLSIRSWRRLSQFKLSTNEDVSGLKPFADWYGYFMSELVRQHTLARTEVEAQANGGAFFSKQLIESTISQNQRQIESLISSTLAGMKSSVETAPSLDRAYHMIIGVPFGKLLGLFNPAQTSISSVIKESLQLIITFIEKDTRPVSLPPNDDSQEYGDWSGFEEMYEVVPKSSEPSEIILYLKNIVQPDVSQLISNCFGEDRSPEDSLLSKAIECWACLAQILVRYQLHSWDTYIDPYGKFSWTALRATSQTRKFTPQFLASCINKNSNLIKQCRTQVLCMWMACLVERMSMLKYQHRLTEALLNEDEALPLFQNLPFYKSRKDNLYHITLSEFTERRVTLISCLLSNMREHMQNLEDSAAQELPSAREEYKELIITLMSSMKANYQALGQVENTVQGKYVEFVQRVVGFLQQHSQTICPLDKFFTDPTSFPLPADDPSYIVARLKSYGVRLSNAKIAKQLVMFLQSVSERAAVDGQQEYFIEQLCTCTNDTYETGVSRKPTLRSFLLQCVFPAYIECSLSKVGAWILAWPVLNATSRILSELIYDIDINDASCISSVINMIEAIFFSIRHAIRLSVDHPGLLEEPYVLITMRSFIDVMTSSLQILDYMKRATVISDNIISLVELFRRNILFAAAVISDPSMAVDPELHDIPAEISNSEQSSSALYSESRAFARNQLQTWLRASWSIHNGKYFLRRGQQTIEIDSGVVKANEVGTLERAKTGFLKATETFLNRINSFDLLDERDLEPIKGLSEPLHMHDFDELRNEMDGLLL